MAVTPTVKLCKSSDGGRIYAEAVGNPQNPSLVFVHGLALATPVFDNLFADERLTNEFYLVRYDMRGHGRSVQPETIEGYSSAVYADDFSAVVREFGLEDPVFVGWSLGGTVLADLTAHNVPLSGAVYIASLPFIGPIMGSVGTDVILGFIPGLTTTDDVALHKKTALAFTDSVFSDPSSVPIALKDAWGGQSILQSPVATTCVLTRPQDPKGLYEAGQKGLPLLLLSGTKDSQVKGKQVEAEIKPYFKNWESVFIEGGGHALHYECPDAVVTELIRFGRKITSKA